MKFMNPITWGIFTLYSSNGPQHCCVVTGHFGRAHSWAEVVDDKEEPETLEESHCQSEQIINAPIK